MRTRSRSNFRSNVICLYGLQRAMRFCRQLDFDGVSRVNRAPLEDDGHNSGVAMEISMLISFQDGLHETGSQFV